jgi:gliding motility-associated-like protein
MKKIIVVLFILTNYNLFSQNINLINNGNFGFYTVFNGAFNGQILIDTEANNLNHCWFRAGKNFGAIYTSINNPQVTITQPKPYSDSNALYNLNSFQFKYIISADSVLSPIKDIERYYGQTKLIKPLIAGKKYIFNMYLGGVQAVTLNQNPNNSSTHIITNIGVHFSANKIADYNNNGQLHVIPQINFTNYSFPKVDTFEYTKLTATYTAIGGEQFLTIGNFDSVQNFIFKNFTITDLMRDTVDVTIQSLVIDDVSLVEDSNSIVINPELFSIGKDTIICNGSNITLTASEYYSDYLWNIGDTSRQININKAGKYWCTANAGCTMYSDTIIVSIYNKLENFITPSEVNLCIGESAILYAPDKNLYLWSTGEQAQTIEVNQNQIYYCTISNICGSYTDSVKVNINSCEVIIPNAFSPNGDGLNDEFRVISTDFIIENLSVYNILGQKIFNYAGSLYGWDGKFKGFECPIGIYYYVCRISSNGKRHFKKGDITLVR